jgi:SAM-dependent methyltransferase
MIKCNVHRHEIYPSKVSYYLNTILFPLKMIIPQPLLSNIPVLLTNREIRIRSALLYVHGRLLDIGCGENHLVKKYREMGGQGIGVDVYPWDGVDMLVQDSSNLPFADDSFDAVTFIACLNHIPNREDVLREAIRLLVHDGIMILTNLHPFVSRVWHAWAFWDTDQRERGLKQGEVWGFTGKQLRELLDRTGFTVELMRRFSWGLNQIYVCKPRA